MNYFTFEVHIRQQIQELMENVNKKATSDRENVMEAIRQIKGLTNRVFDMEHFLLRNQEVHTVFDEINQRFGEVNVEANMIKIRAAEDKKYFENRLEQMDKKLANMERTLDVYVSIKLL